MHAQTCMVQLGNLHGWTSQLAWFSSPKCMVPLPALHGWTKKRLFQALRPSTLNPYMCIDFAIRFGFAENNSKKIAGCDTRTSHPAIAELRKVRHDNFAPCDSLMLHLATSRYRTLPLSSVAQCDSNSLFLNPKISASSPRLAGDRRTPAVVGRDAQGPRPRQTVHDASAIELLPGFAEFFDTDDG